MTLQFAPGPLRETGPADTFGAPLATRERAKLPSLPPPETPSLRADAHLLSAELAYPPGTGLADVAPVDPAAGRTTKRLVYVNGIMTTPERQRAELRLLVDHFGVSGVGVHNATHGLRADLRGYFDERASAAGHALPAVKTVTQLLADAVDRQEPTLFVGHSLGALLIANASRNVEAQLRAQGLEPDEIERRLGCIEIVTLAGVAARYIDGPRYTHHVNRADTFPMFFGIGMSGHPGRDAVVRYYDYDVSDESGVPPSRFYSAQAFNATSHGLAGYLKAIEGKAPPRREYEGG